MVATKYPQTCPHLGPCVSLKYPSLKLLPLFFLKVSWGKHKCYIDRNGTCSECVPWNRPQPQLTSPCVGSQVGDFHFCVSVGTKPGLPGTSIVATSVAMSLLGGRLTPAKLKLLRCVTRPTPSIQPFHGSFNLASTKHHGELIHTYQKPRNRGCPRNLYSKLQIRTNTVAACLNLRTTVHFSILGHPACKLQRL